MNKGLLTNAYVYLCGPIQNAKDCYSWRYAITASLTDLGINVFDPNKDHFVNQPTESYEDRQNMLAQRSKGDFEFVHDYMKKVIRRDLRQTDLSTFLIGHIDPDIPTWGTVHELVLAAQQGKAILIHTEDKKKFPLWLIGLLNMDLVFESWSDLMDYVRKIHFAEIYAEPKYWKIVAHE